MISLNFHRNVRLKKKIALGDLKFEPLISINKMIWEGN